MADKNKMKKTRHQGVYQRGNKYVYRYRDAAGVNRQGSARTLKDAVAERQAHMAAVRAGGFQAPTNLTFAEFARQALASYTGRTSKGLREKTRDDYIGITERHIIPFLGHLKLTSITPRDVKQFLAHMNNKPHPRKPGRLLSARQIRLTMMVLKLLLSEAVEDGLLVRNPAPDRVSVTEGPGGGRDGHHETRSKAMSRAEVIALFAKVPERDREFFAFLLQTGLRIGEAIEIRWQDLELDLPHPEVHLRRTWTYRIGHGTVIHAPKTAAGTRAVPLSPTMAARLRSRRGWPEELVFRTPRGKQMRPGNFQTGVLKPAAVAAGVPWVTFHSFRHTCASVLFAAGRNVKQVQRWLGHATPIITLNTYIHLIDDGVGDASCFDWLD